jgi:DNA-binding NarL/FixJ family response regulator
MVGQNRRTQRRWRGRRGAVIDGATRADGHELIRDGLRQLLVDELQIQEVLEAASFDQTIELLLEKGAGDLIIVDLRMPGLSGPEALAALRDGFPRAKLAVLSASEDRADILAALEAGVHGYVPKSLPAAEIAAALKAVLAGRIFVPAVIGRRDKEIARLPPAQGASPSMTVRQRQVFQQLLKGQASKEIARTLGIAEGTVKIHLAAIYRALGVRTRAEAISGAGGAPGIARL